MRTFFLAASLCFALCLTARADEFAVNPRPALPHPTALVFPSSDLLFDLNSAAGQFAVGIRPSIALGLDPGLVPDGAALTAKKNAALAAQAQIFADIKYASETIERARIQETLCGKDDNSQHVEFYNGKGVVSRAFVDQNEPHTLVLRWRDDIGKGAGGIQPGTVAGNRWCSASYIGNSRILTAGHCFTPDDGSHSGWVTPYREVDGQRTYLQPAELAPLFFAEFRYQVDGQTSQIRSPTPFPVTRLLEFKNGGLDYSVAEIGTSVDGKSIDALTPPTPLGNPATSPDGSIIAIIQHPEGGPKKVAAGHILGRSDPWLYYDDLDTKDGASGSGVLTSDGHLIAVHTNGGCTELSPVGDVRQANAGVSIGAIEKVSAVLTPPP